MAEAETTTQKLSAGQGVIMTAISVIGLLLGVGIAVGVYQTKAAALEQKTSSIEQKTDKLQEQVVTKEEFRELKSDVKEIKNDMKDLTKTAKR